MQSDVVKKLQTHLDYCFEANRKATFKSWVFSNEAKCSAAKLAEAGFIFTGTKHEPDSVKCFLCNKSLDCWDEDDDPWAEHRKHASYCKFAKMDKPEKTLTMTEFVDIRNDAIETFFKNLMTEGLDHVKDCQEHIVEMLKRVK